jgi:RimJ/RimL family protein N-acetyltransferase
MTIQTKNLILASHLRRHLRALLRGRQELKTPPAFVSRTEFASNFLALHPSSWPASKMGGKLMSAVWFRVIHKTDNALIGTGVFPAPPDSDGVAEIAYGIAPAYQGRGYATEVANALIDFASRNARVREIHAHTLAQTNASTRVLEKCGI